MRGLLYIDILLKKMRLPKTRDSDQGGLSSIDCPECSEKISIGLPRTAEIEYITTDNLNDKDLAQENQLDRPRKANKSCGNKHLITILYDW